MIIKIKPFITFVILFIFTFVSAVLAEEITPPPPIFSLDGEGSYPKNDISEEDVVPSLEIPALEKTFLESKPYKAKVSFVNRRTNVLKTLNFSQANNQKKLNNFNIQVAQCLKDYNGNFGNDVAFIEVSDEEKTVLFSGWVFKKRPSVNSFEHPIYSLFLLSCS